MVDNRNTLDLRSFDYEIKIDALRGILHVYPSTVQSCSDERNIIYNAGVENTNQPLHEHIFGHLNEVVALMEFCWRHNSGYCQRDILTYPIKNSNLTLLLNSEIATTLYNYIRRQHKQYHDRMRAASTTGSGEVTHTPQQCFTTQAERMGIFVVEEAKHLITVDPDTRILRVHTVPNPDPDTPVCPIIAVYGVDYHKDYPVVLEYEMASGSVLRKWWTLLQEQNRDIRRCRGRKQEPPMYGFVFTGEAPTGTSLRYHHELVGDLLNDLTYMMLNVPRMHRLMDEPSEFVCMKVVTRHKELIRADPPKAKALGNRVDMTWARELLLAAQKAKEEEENK